MWARFQLVRFGCFVVDGNRHSLRESGRIFIGLIIMICANVCSPIARLSRVSLGYGVAGSRRYQGYSAVRGSFLSRFFRGINERARSFRCSRVGANVPFLAGLPYRIQVNVSFPCEAKINIYLIANPNYRSNSKIDGILGRHGASNSYLIVASGPPQYSCFGLQSSISRQFPRFLFERVMSSYC